MPKYCFVLPCFQHAFTLRDIFRVIEEFQFKIFLIDDGSDELNHHELKKICAEYKSVELLVHPRNQGKGAAMSTGLQAAWAQGFTHGIQIDSDGQHDISRIEEMIELSRKFPADLISGRPVYDATVPRARLYGRYLTHACVWAETWSLQIKDSMCGFRIYPLRESVELLQKGRVGQRMDFDTEIMVRLFWMGVGVRQMPVAVHYPLHGISHFDFWFDNVRITKMHFRLLFGMLWRWPGFVLRKKSSTRPWNKIEEYGTLLGIHALSSFYRLAGRRLLNLILYPICLYYFLVSGSARKASRDYQQVLRDYVPKDTHSFSTFRHIYSFASMAMDKFAVWFGDIGVADVVPEDLEALIAISKSQEGAFFLTSHYGNIEVCRAVGRLNPEIRFNALVYQENSKKFNTYLNRINAESSLNLISVKEVGPEMAMLLKEKVENKEWVFMVGDRLSINETQRTISMAFLGKQAQFSEGPFILAYLLEVPIYLIHCYREGKRFRIQLKKVNTDRLPHRSNRQEHIQQVAKDYTHELESLILKDPLQWYNFFDFWRTPS